MHPPLLQKSSQETKQNPQVVSVENPSSHQWSGYFWFPLVSLRKWGEQIDSQSMWTASLSLQQQIYYKKGDYKARTECICTDNSSKVHWTEYSVDKWIFTDNNCGQVQRTDGISEKECHYQASEQWHNHIIRYNKTFAKSLLWFKNNFINVNL